MTKAQNLLDLDPVSLIAYCASLGEKPFRARQLQRCIYQNGISDFDAMTVLSKSLRDKLKTCASIRHPPILKDCTSKDGTRKWVLDIGTGNAIETVYIPEQKRGTLCISSQAGCAVNCYFCSTGKQGFSRNLVVGEIIGQLWMAESALLATREGIPSNERLITNVVMMGMGEPLLNFDAVVSAMRLMIDDHAYGLSRRRVTLSTSGVVPMINRLADELPVALAVSLHAPNDTLRDKLVPLNQKYSLKELMVACSRYLRVAPRDFITFEYCMLDGINDSDKCAQQLLTLTRDVSCKFNLIPFNPFPKSRLSCSRPDRINRFAQILIDGGVVSTVRRTRGADINAACGQLAGEVCDRTCISKRELQSANAGFTLINKRHIAYIDGSRIERNKSLSRLI